MRFAPLALLLVAGTALAQAPERNETPNAKPQPRKADKGWKGQKVVAKQGIIEFHTIDRVDENGDPIFSSSTAADPHYFVRDDRDDQVFLRSASGQEGWVDKSTVIPFKEAVAFFDKTIEENPNVFAYYLLRCQAHQANGDLDLAMRDIDEAIRLQPKTPELLGIRAALWSEKKEFGKALAEVDEAMRLKPEAPHLFLVRALIRRHKGEYAATVADLEEALKLDGTSFWVLNDIAWNLATCPDDAVRDGPRAVKYAEKAVEMTNRKAGAILDTLAAAYAEAKRFDDAVRVQQEAIADRDFVLSSGNSVSERVDLYRQKKAYREK